MSQTLFDQNHKLNWPEQQRFPVNEPSQGYNVYDIVTRDIESASWLYIITGFTSLSNLVKFFGNRDFDQLAWTKIVFGFEMNERLAQKQSEYQLKTEIKNYWLRQNVSITLCGPILNLIEKIRAGLIDVRFINKLHAKIYVSNKSAILGSSNFSTSGLKKLREANVRVINGATHLETDQFNSIKKLAENYWELGTKYSEDLIMLLQKWLKDATWQEALARALAEVLESKWMEDYPDLYQAVMSKELWPSQKLGVGRAMNIIRDQGNLLIADPTGSGKTKMATALAYTIFHWMYENGQRERSNAFIVSPPQVLSNWKDEEATFKLFNRVESTGKLSFGTDKDRAQLLKDMECANILIIDEAHNFLNPGTKRSKAVQPRCSTHVLLATATPINKKPEDLLRLIELLDIDNLNDEDLDSYLQLRGEVRKHRNPEHIAKLKKYINQFILRRTKAELNKMIEWEPEAYINKRGVRCCYPTSRAEIYLTGETEEDRQLASKIAGWLDKLKGIHYLQNFVFPEDKVTSKDRRDYLKQRFRSAPALAGFAVKSALRSSACALYEFLYGSEAAMDKYDVKSVKMKSGNMIKRINQCMKDLPKIDFELELLAPEDRWIADNEAYARACEAELQAYEEIGTLCRNISDARERAKAKLLAENAAKYSKILAFDSTVLTLDYLKKLLQETAPELKVIVATGQSEHRKKEVREVFSGENIGSGETVVALCSDAMAESINLPGAKALVLLDMPSVLRIIEQRIGRIERMDSEHPEIFIYWPDDAPEFSLAGDRRMIEILVATDNLIGNNVSIPQKGVFEKYYTDSMNAIGMAKAYEQYAQEEQDWEGVKDTTQYLLNLIGKDGLISREQYNTIKEVTAGVKTEISFVESDESWSFFAIKGDARRSAKWLMIDTDGKPITEFSLISEKLVSYLQNRTVIQRTWKEVDSRTHIEQVVRKLRKHERELLPPKKKRALDVAHDLLAAFIKKTPEKSIDTLTFLRKLERLFDPNSEEGQTIDYNHFAGLWLEILLPALDAKKATAKKRTIHTLRKLKSADVPLTLEKLKELYERCQFSYAIDELIVACIIAVEVK